MECSWNSTVYLPNWVLGERITSYAARISTKRFELAEPVSDDETRSGCVSFASFLKEALISSNELFSATPRTSYAFSVPRNSEWLDLVLVLSHRLLKLWYMKSITHTDLSLKLNFNGVENEFVRWDCTVIAAIVDRNFAGRNGYVGKIYRWN